ncbi:MAG: integrase [Deltaproteobacteria bacterium]|nr:integrase [Deltaproteobacteria bacterium]
MKSPQPPKRKLLERVRATIRLMQYSRATEKTYTSWIKRFILFHNKRHPTTMDTPEIEQDLTHLAVQKNVAASTQNQALHAILFLYNEVLKQELSSPVDALRAKKPRRLPVVLSKDEVTQILQQLEAPYLLLVQLLYGCGLRLMECLTLRVKDLDFSQNLILIRDGKGGKDRITMLPSTLRKALQKQLEHAKKQHQADLLDGYGATTLPYALTRKSPNAATSWGWQYIFPSKQRCFDPDSETYKRHHIHQSSIHKAIKRATKRCNIHKHVSSHTFRHSFATHLLQDGYDIRTIQELLGHKELSTTMIYTHVLNRGRISVKSPLDRL